MMLWPDEVREPAFGFLDEDIDVRQQELTMAQSLIETLSGDFEPEQYSDNYREALQALIEAKVEGREVVQPAEPAGDTGTVVDLMAALRASVEAARQGRTGGAADDEGTAGGTTSDGGSAAKKATGSSSAKKTAGKSAASKSTAKKTAKKAASKSSPRKKTAAKRANARKSA
jgi:DNA end-binding protein Ku